VSVGTDHGEASIMERPAVVIQRSIECADHEDQVTHACVIVKTKAGRRQPFLDERLIEAVQRSKSVSGDWQRTVRRFALAFGADDR
jgi:hypothetical protein